MKKRFRNGICAVLGVCLLAGLTSFPAAAESHTFSHPETTLEWKVPVGTTLRFQTPPLKRGSRLCYTAGNGEILSTFLAGEPIPNAGGTLSYNLGFSCLKAGESGLYINRNGMTFPVARVQVVNDKEKDGFPLSTTFERIFANWKVEKISVRNESTEQVRQTTTAVKIRSFKGKLAPERLYRNCGTATKGPGDFTVSFYFQGQRGAYVYSPGNDFYKEDGFSAPLPEGGCVEESLEEVYAIITEFYAGLS
jgi:hypothetical protein